MSSHLDVDVCQTDDSVPYVRKERDPDVGDAIAAVEQAHEAIKANARERHDLVVSRRAAIHTALTKGATYTELASHLDLSIERVRQMAKQEPKGPQ